MFQEFALGSSYSMEVTISDRPNEPFGSRNSLFNSKKAAKVNAAREAVRWLRENEHMPEKDHRSNDGPWVAATISSNTAKAEPIPLPSNIPTNGEVSEPGISPSAGSVAKSNNFLSSPCQMGYSIGEQVTCEYI